MSDFEKKGNWIPWFTAFIILFLYVISLGNNGTYTWAFNAVVYGNPAGWGALFTLACILLLVVITKYQPKLDSWEPSLFIQWLLLGTIVVIFVLAIIIIKPLYPHMEGDGTLDGGRLRDYLVAIVGYLLPNRSEVSVAQICWKSVGIIYIIFCLYFIVKSTGNFCDRFLGLLYFASVPPVLNFIGYIDSYGAFFTLGCMFLGLLYLLQNKPSISLLLGVTIVFILGAIAHYRYYTLLVYPILWICLWIMGKYNTPKLYRTAFLIIFILGLIATSVGLTFINSPGPPHAFGYMFNEISKYDGVLIALYHPLLLMLSFLFTYFIFLICYLVMEKNNFFSLYNPLKGAILYGSLGMFLAYYFGQLLKQITTFEILDFIAQAGCLGILFVTPLFVFFIETGWKKWLYCFVILNLFITIPNFVVHGGHGMEQRLINNLANERSVTGWEMSPYIHVATHFKTDNANELAAKVFEMGANDQGYYKKFDSVNLYYLTGSEYEWGQKAKGKEDLRKLLQYYPVNCRGMLQGEIQLLHSDYKIDYVRIKDMKEMAGQFLKDTQKPVYSQIIILCNQILSTQEVEPTLKDIN